MRPVRRLFAACLLVAGLVMPAAAHGQQEERVGSFRISSGTVTLAPVGGMGEGTITWRCFGDTLAPSVTLRLDGEDANAVVTYAIWRFDGEKADTVFLLRIAREWLPDGWRTAFTRRARTAQRLTVRVLGNPPSAPGVEHVYDLGGGGEALGRLSCIRSPSSERRIVGWPPPEGLVTAPSADGEARTYEAAEVDRPAEAVNMPQLMRLLLRAYPSLMRDAGEGGTVVLRFRVLEDGRVDAGAVSILHSTPEGLATPTGRWLPVLHFRPARLRGRPVRAWVELPVTYEMLGSPPTRPLVRPGL